ncbi:MAG: hypothetical protein MPK75_08345 [Alphaproteobacteria bacterium]|nr:hypothetical protein [Alphaproteobacteria bacterium]
MSRKQKTSIRVKVRPDPREERRYEVSIPGGKKFVIMPGRGNDNLDTPDFQFRIASNREGGFDLKSAEGNFKLAPNSSGGFDLAGDKVIFEIIPSPQRKGCGTIKPRYPDSRRSPTEFIRDKSTGGYDLFGPDASIPALFAVPLLLDHIDIRTSSRSAYYKK